MLQFVIPAGRRVVKRWAGRGGVFSFGGNPQGYGINACITERDWLERSRPSGLRRVGRAWLNLGLGSRVTAEPPDRAAGRADLHGPGYGVPELAERTIVLKDIAVRRGGHEVFNDLSLTIAPGTLTAIVGPSGVGKTTLLGVLNGLLRPVAGTIAITGLGALDDPAVMREHRLQTATVFQEHALIGRLSALDNVLLGLADLRHPLSPWPWPSALRRRAAEALRDRGLLHRANSRTGNLSGGERQRVGIARALVRKPSLLLGDEPFSALDPALARQLGDELKSLVSAAGITVVLVLHQIDTARRLADRIVGLAGGRVVFDGPPQGFDAAAQARVFPLTCVAFKRHEP